MAPPILTNLEVIMAIITGKTLEDKKDVEIIKKLSDIKHRRKEIVLTAEEKERISRRKLKASRGYGDTRVVDGKVYRRLRCFICGKWYEYDTALKPYYFKQGRWNAYFQEPDACLQDSLCEMYYHKYKTIKMKEAGFSQKHIDKYNPAKHNKEIEKIKA